MKRNPMTGLNSFFDDFFTKDLFNWNEKNLTEMGFTMPSDIVDVEHIEAKYDNGILKLAVPKRENAKKEVKSIEIK